jgi:hyperosmotically inducible periplasmic protein
MTYRSALILLLAAPILVFASPAQDRKIESAAKSSYTFKVVLDNKVQVRARDGVVTLTGAVNDREDKALAQDTVENLPGVRSVSNHLAISSTHPEKSDNWIKWKIRGRLLVSSDVSFTATTVAVNQGVVTLGGSALNPAQKELTGIHAAEIDGVVSVDNQMVIAPTAVEGDQTVGEHIDDASITTQVKFAILRSKATRVLKSQVTTTGGVVHVTGEAGSDAEKALVTKLASGIRGVKSVNNEMIVL